MVCGYFTLRNLKKSLDPGTKFRQIGNAIFKCLVLRSFNYFSNNKLVDKSS